MDENQEGNDEDGGDSAARFEGDTRVKASICVCEIIPMCQFSSEV